VKSHWTLVPALLLLSANPERLGAQGTAYEQMQAFSGVLSQVRLNYVDSVEFGNLMQASIRGLLSSLDPYSHYVTRRDHMLRLQWDRGELAGPGLWLENSGGSVTVLSVAGPAKKAGIRPGDRLIRLNDGVVAVPDAEALELQLLGAEGTKLRLTVERINTPTPETLSVTLKREPLPRTIIGTPRLVAPGIGFLRVTEFTTDAADSLEEAIRKILKMGAKQLLLDLRGNPGGDIPAVVQIASLFLPPGSEVFRIRSRKRINFDPITLETGKGEFAKLPLILLVDEGTASAAEILAGSLQDHDRALILGRRSFGKAVMQTALPLPNGDVVWLTTARIITPSGRLIQRDSPQDAEVYRTSRGREVRGGGGILPDIVLPGSVGLPTWFSIAADSGYDEVADSVAQLLGTDPASRDAWARDTAGWDARLVAPFLMRVRSGLQITEYPGPPLRARMGLFLAERAAFIRWGPEAAEDFSIRNDADAHAALAYFPRIPELLRH